MPRPLRHSRPHDYPDLIRRWRKVAKAAGLKVRKFAQAGGLDGFAVENTCFVHNAPTLYFSAAIHGDEPASSEGLISWAEKNQDRLKAWNLLIFPCLNPWGLVANSRLDADGRDLNRLFHDTSVPQIAAHRELLGTRRFDLAITLHEDYDALGFYLYEVPGPKPYWGEHLTRAARKFVPIETRRRIEGRAAKDGIVRRAIKPDFMPTWPEAFVLYFAHCPRVFTVETPSEFHFDDRVDAHVAVLAEAVRLAEQSARQKTPHRKSW
jgi:protein MpaA